MKVDELFNVKYGVNLELLTCEATTADDVDGVNFVARTSSNNGVVARVKRIEGIVPQTAGTLSCAGGGSVLETFVQTKPYYSGRDLYVLTPKHTMSLPEKLYYCMCIRENAYRYSYGRQANKTLKNIELPDSIPQWVYSKSIEPIKTNVPKKNVSLDIGNWKEYEIKDIFDIRYGINLELFNCELSDSCEESINFVSRTSANNGVVAQVKPIAGKTPQKAGLISCSGGGSVLSTFVQKCDFYSGRDLYILTPKYPMTIHSKLFCCTVIEQSKYKFNYGRQANKTLPILKIKLPCLSDGTPNFAYMEQYIKSLPYGDRI